MARTAERTNIVPSHTGLAPEGLRRFHDQMLLIRRFEEKVNEMYTLAKIGGYCHLNIGEEAAIVGSLAALRQKDYIFTSYREHGHAITWGMDPRAVMAELFGREAGVSKGRGGSMHLFDAERHFMGGWAIVGAHMPIAVGAAMAVKYRAEEEIVACYIGDGATNTGAFHESLNAAKLWELPILFIVVNNQYEMGTAVDKTSAVPEQYLKGATYGVEGDRVDGMDVMAVVDAAQKAVKHVREHKDPLILELLTYRFKGHSVIDPARYRSDAEVTQWQLRDPIMLLRQRLTEAGTLTDADVEKAEQQIAELVEECVAYADASPFPDVSTLFDYLYAEEGES